MRMNAVTRVKLVCCELVIGWEIDCTIDYELNEFVGSGCAIEE